MLNIFIFLCFFGGAFAQSSDDGSCVEIPSEEFENERLMGRWRDVLRSKTVSDEEMECLEVNFSITGPDEFEIIYSAKSNKDDKYYSIKGDGQISGNLFNVTNHIPIFGLDSAFAWVIGSDYDTYLILYGCKCEASTCTSYGWLKYREYDDSLEFDDYNQLYQDALREKNIPYLEMEAVAITDCSSIFDQ